jgi:hypothetical protein
MLYFPEDLVRRLLLLALLGVWAGSLFGGFAFGQLNADGTHRTSTRLRMFSSLALVIAASLWALTPADTTVIGVLIAVGMLLGFLGDLFMAKLIPVKEPVLGGIGAFGLGHIAYIVALWLLGEQSGLNAPQAQWGALMALWLIGVACWYLVVFRPGARTMLHWAALPYTLLLSSTAGLAVGLALQSPAFILLAVGAVLFLLSDLLLAAQLFNNLYFRLIGDIVWFLYGPGQMLIVYGAGSALTFLTRSL